MATTLNGRSTRGLFNPEITNLVTDAYMQDRSNFLALGICQLNEANDGRLNTHQ